MMMTMMMVMEDNKEEALGSVDLTSPSSSVPLRSSARVSKKKLDSLTKLASSPTAEKREPSDKGETQEETEKTPSRKQLIWPLEDKNLFFEAVSEYGKDFAAIQRYIALKNKHKNNEAKTKEQIRRFYYRTWAKISPKLHFPSRKSKIKILGDIQKPVQELYGLINYGELRKKMKVRTKKEDLRLNELIFKGFTQLRGKNKTIHIRTPRCRVLRRFCQVDEQQEPETKLPSTVRVELVPADNQTWAHVQGLAQNPRVHILAPLQYRITNLLRYLQKRWLPRHEKYKIKAMEGYEADTGSEEETSKELLVIKARPNAHVHVVQVNLSHYNSHTKICLSSYEEKLGKKGACLEILNKLYAELGTKMKKPKTECASDKEQKTKSDDVKDEAILTNNNEPVKEEPVKENSDDLINPEAGKDETRPEEDDNRNHVAEENDTATDELINKVKEGLTIENSHTLTVGDLYLMVGSDYKLQLDYHWRAGCETASVHNLGSMLKKLVHLAKLTKTRCAVQCPCGHQCSDPKRLRKESTNEDLGMVTQVNPSDVTFRRPIVQINRRVTSGPGRIDQESFRTQIDKMTPRYCNRRGRGITSKTVVVQRTLPILPKGLNGPPVFPYKVIPQPAQFSGEFLPIQQAEPEENVSNPLLGPSGDPPPSPTPSISTLLEESFKSFPSTSSNFPGAEDSRLSPTPSTELREALLSDCSLSSLFSHLEAPTRPAADTNYDSAPLDVETHLQYLLTESSMDFSSKFAALAAEVSSESSQ